MTEDEQDEQRWRNEKVFCQGEGEYSHEPTPMSFERVRGGWSWRHGAYFVCSLCNGRKFAERSSGRLSFEWDTHPNQ